MPAASTPTPAEASCHSSGWIRTTDLTIMSRARAANGGATRSSYRDLWERLFGLVWDDTQDVRFVWIKGHAGDPNNTRVDRLARAAALSPGE